MVRTEGKIVTLPPCQDVKTTTSLSVTIIITSVLKEGLLMLITCRSVVELCHQLVKVSRRRVTVDVGQGGLATCLKLTMEEVA